tara:strand:+ start:1009 stop:1773 length:765 start_codon:yes stop_codon:yes gene_type:complete
MQLSIITISYKNIQELKETLDSINSQVINCHENILVLSGYSEKEKIEITQSYSSDFRKFYWDLDNSLFNAMNVGIQKSSGDYILFLNAGDSFIDNKSMDFINEYLQNNHEKCCSFKTYQVYNNIKIVRDNLPIRKFFLKSGLRTLPPHQGFVAPNHKKIFFNENLKVSADNDWMKNNIAKYGIIYKSEVIVDFKLGGQSTYPTMSIIFIKLKHEKFIRFIIECIKFFYSLFVSREIYFITMAKIRGYKIIRKKK